jgi:hypothetical protein
MAPHDATIPVRLGFMPVSEAIPDPDHPGFLRAGPRTAAPYEAGVVEYHECQATDLSDDDAVGPDLFESGFGTVDLSPLGALQQRLAEVREAGHVTDDEAEAIRGELDGATLRCADGRWVTVMHIADEGFIMRKSGPNGMSVVGRRTPGMNDHGVATSIHADQDVHGTPLTQIMDGRAPELFRHDSPGGHNHDAGLMLVNLWIPLQQVTQPLTLGDGRSIDRTRHQLRYGLPTTSFLEREEDMVINDIYTFLHDPDQRWYFHSDMDHRVAYVFNTLSTPHGSCTLPGEDVAEHCYRSLEAAEAAVADGDASALAEAVSSARSATVPADTPRPLREAIGAMVIVADEAAGDPARVCTERATQWSTASRAARRRVIRMSLEMRMVISISDVDR